MDKYCKECFASAPRHSSTCSKASEDQVRSSIKFYKRRNIELENWLNQANNRAMMWEGKFRIVKHENNKLRSKLWKIKQQDGAE